MKGQPVGNDIDLHLGRRLRRRRRLLGLTQQQLAAVVGVRFQQIQKYEKGNNRISVSTLVSLAKALNVAPEFFLADAGLPVRDEVVEAVRQDYRCRQLVTSFMECSPPMKAAVLNLARALERAALAASANSPGAPLRAQPA